ncbi:hypothetical protein NDU88_003903 [Pleurodeles waltl]|uniref:Uncharacterized protein n=1 Tax=Pleurodeles waltl TaxID=8319 RepID=A0AAV7NIC0_PLEWA|nr:hypothetical protein NDU88_003903 [Pleurodeles waltl]
MEAETYPTLLWLRLRVMPHGSGAGSRESPPASDGCPLVMVAMSAVVALSEHIAGLVAVLAAVSVAEVLAVVHVSAPVGRHSKTSSAASDGCPLGKMLGTVAEAADVHVAVQVAMQVAAAVLVAV